MPSITKLCSFTRTMGRQFLINSQPNIIYSGIQTENLSKVSVCIVTSEVKCKQVAPQKYQQMPSHSPNKLVIAREKGLVRYERATTLNNPTAYKFLLCPPGSRAAHKGRYNKNHN